MRRGLRGSLLLKLLAVSVASGVLIALLAAAALFVAIGHGSQPGNRLLRRNVAQYLLYVERELGEPPTVEAAKRVAAVTGLAIRVDRGGAVVASEPDLPSPAEAARHVRPRLERFGLPTGRFGGRFFFRDRRGGTDYLFFGPQGVDLDVREEALGLVAGLILAVVIGGYLTARKLLAPLRELAVGVHRVGEGDLAHRLKETGSDELGELARSFNAMSARLGEMLRGKEQLLLDVSHELRSPLARMRLALELTGDGRLERSLAEDLDELERMTAELLESARLGSAHGQIAPEELDLAPLVADVAAAYATRAPGVRLSAPPPLMARADAARTRTVLRNVLENACKYAADAGEPVVISARTIDGRVVVTVEDRGPGVPAEEAERVFEPFYRVDKSRSKATGGFGLGLSLCRTIMRAQGGDATLAPRPGGGAAVTLTFAGV